MVLVGGGGGWWVVVMAAVIVLTLAFNVAADDWLAVLENGRRIMHMQLNIHTPLQIRSSWSWQRGTARDNAAACGHCKWDF